jgi:GTPase SAR1 family protein
MNREEYINELRTDLLALVEEYLTPVALRYGYSESPLEANIKWRPQVLVLGNYSSGKSTLINDFLGADIQATGQAPTDDSFTVITYDGSAAGKEEICVTEERDGKFLLNDPEYPYESLKKHGQRFASHFRLKKVNSPFLKNLAVIDTPGMLDSITERDRGYNYQDVIGDLAQIADLVLVLFDPHKAGTVREAHTSLRDTLPVRTFEDRILFVLNRIDECSSLIDLLQVYGTLCWNLSQITGRKDIPPIHLMYSPQASRHDRKGVERDTSYLEYLANQREELKKAILQAPRHRLDHLASFVEIHGERLSHLLEALINYRVALRQFNLKVALSGIVAAVFGGAGALLAVIVTDIVPLASPEMMYGVGGGAGLFILLVWMSLFKKYALSRFHRRRLKKVDELTPLGNQTRRDNWDAIREMVQAYLKKTSGRFSLGEVKREFKAVRMVFETGAREIRSSLNELANIRYDDAAEVDAWISKQTHLLKRHKAKPLK